MADKKKSDVIWNILLIFCVAVFLFSAWKLAGYLIEYKKGENAYESITDQAVVMPQIDNIGNTNAGNIENNAGESEVFRLKEPILPVIDWDVLHDMNEDLVGWLYIPDTIIHYPIVQGADNSYYLTHTFDGTKNKCGTIFMDAANREDFTSRNTILHGHNMKTGKMFGSLRRFEKKEFWEQHPYIYIIREDSIWKYEIFSSGRTTADSDVYTLEFGSDDSYASYIKKRMSGSYYDTGVDVTVDDYILTLSTCTSDTEVGRRVVQAVLVEVKEK